jgi:hypothetical protein
MKNLENVKTMFEIAIVVTTLAQLSPLVAFGTGMLSIWYLLIQL